MAESRTADAAKAQESVNVEQKLICDKNACIIGYFTKSHGNHEAESTNADLAETTMAAANPLPGAKTSTPSSASPHSTGKLTKDERQDLIQYYTGVFVKSFRKFSAFPLGEIGAANQEVRIRAKDNQYASIPAMHADYEALLLENSESGLDHDVYEAWVKFSEVEAYWWGKCITLSTQRKRRIFIRKVVEQIKKESFDPEAFQHEYREYYGKGLDEGQGESESEDDG